MVLAFLVSSDAEAPGRVRDVVRQHLRCALEERIRYDLELLLTELVSNAVRHGSAEQGGEIAVRVELSETIVSVSITDPGEGFDAAELEPTPRTEAGGVGVFLPDRPSTRRGGEGG